MCVLREGSIHPQRTRGPCHASQGIPLPCRPPADLAGWGMLGKDSCRSVVLDSRWLSETLLDVQLLLAEASGSKAKTEVKCLAELAKNIKPNFLEHPEMVSFEFGLRFPSASPPCPGLPSLLPSEVVPALGRRGAAFPASLGPLAGLWPPAEG